MNGIIKHVKTTYFFGYDDFFIIGVKSIWSTEVRTYDMGERTAVGNAGYSLLDDRVGG